MEDKSSRSRWLIGRQAVERLADATVAVFGLGGVGSIAAEALCRSGVGRLILVDHDRIALSNFNRQLFATDDQLGELKTDAARRRLLSIRPDCRVETHPVFWPADPDNQMAASILTPPVDYIIDAIDTVSAKISLIVHARSHGIPLISSMGTGYKLDPTRLERTDLFATTTCPLARVMRRELRRRGIDRLDVVYSTEEPVQHPDRPEPDGSRQSPASMIFVPASAGLLLASAVVRELSRTAEAGPPGSPSRSSGECGSAD
ncbi:MAG: tRNA threonylcarbamoyladenosine dehydratase [Clostridia bacterium]|nr:tRNA threonylcarbamoyladenosine dehydratase [Clostridia bacterium]